MSITNQNLKYRFYIAAFLVALLSLLLLTDKGFSSDLESTQNIEIEETTNTPQDKSEEEEEESSSETVDDDFSVIGSE